MMKKTLLFVSLFAFLLVSCNKDDENSPAISVPDTYTFLRDGMSSVSYSGQIDRLAMLDELADYMEEDREYPLSSSKLLEMYANQNAPFENADLNASSKQLKSKTAASADYFSANTSEQAQIRIWFESLLEEQALISQSGELDAAPGQAGIADFSRLVNAEGIEVRQVFEKSLMGACLLDQMLNNYLSTSVLDAGSNIANNDAGTVEEGKNYTTMEHKWDESYGYAYGIEFEFWQKYIIKVNEDEDFSGIAEDIHLAFRTGRQAIVEKNYTLRDEQAAIIREKMSFVVAVRAVHYLQAGKENLIDPTEAFHDLSEGYGFIYSLRFTHDPSTGQPYFSKSEVDTMLATLTGGTNGFWDVDTVDAAIDSISSQIASRFGFEVAATL